MNTRPSLHLMTATIFRRIGTYFLLEIPRWMTSGRRPVAVGLIEQGPVYLLVCPRSSFVRLTAHIPLPTSTVLHPGPPGLLILKLRSLTVLRCRPDSRGVCYSSNSQSQRGTTSNSQSGAVVQGSLANKGAVLGHVVFACARMGIVISVTLKLTAYLGDGG